jgi:hypothetical protein
MYQDDDQIVTCEATLPEHIPVVASYRRGARTTEFWGPEWDRAEPGVERVDFQAAEGDERGRTSLARVRSHQHDRYIVEEFPDGTLVLTPAVTITAVELAALRDPVVRAAVAVAKSGDPSELRRRPSKSR